jgi:hypothetical protein
LSETTKPIELLLLFPISAKNKHLVYDRPMNISAMFGSNLFCGFRQKDENVKFSYITFLSESAQSIEL